MQTLTQTVRLLFRRQMLPHQALILRFAQRLMESISLRTIPLTVSTATSTTLATTSGRWRLPLLRTVSLLVLQMIDVVLSRTPNPPIPVILRPVYPLERMMYTHKPEQTVLSLFNAGLLFPLPVAVPQPRRLRLPLPHRRPHQQQRHHLRPHQVQHHHLQRHLRCPFQL